MSCEQVQRKLRDNPDGLTELEFSHVPECAECFAVFENTVEQPLAVRLREVTMVPSALPELLTHQSRFQLTRWQFENALLPLVAVLTALAVFFALPALPELTRLDQRLAGLDSVPLPRLVETLVDLPEPELISDFADLPAMEPLSGWRITSWRADNGRVQALTDYDYAWKHEIESL